MADVRRRDILRGAIIGPIILSAGKFGQRMPDLDDLDGRTVRKVIDPNNMTALEREHFIKADFPSEVKPWQPFKMTVSVPGHPMAKRHYILSMRVFLDTSLVTFTTLAPTWQLPEVTFTFTFDEGERIDVIVDCTQHGLWGTAMPILITPAAGVSSTESSILAPQAPAASSDSVLVPPSSTGSVPAPGATSTDSIIVPPSTDSIP